MILHVPEKRVRCSICGEWKDADGYWACEDCRASIYEAYVSLLIGVETSSKCTKEEALTILSETFDEFFDRVSAFTAGSELEENKETGGEENGKRNN